MSTDDQSDRQCPLCMEALELDDLNFYPCKCEYQICWFCWHRIRTDENGLCPACRQPYSEEPANFQAVSSVDVLKNKSEKRSKAQQGKNKKMSAEAKKHLAAYRVLQKNLLYVVGLPARFNDMEQLRRAEFFNRFGKVVKISTSPAINNINACSAYVTFEKDEEALRAIQECMYLHEIADLDISFTKEDMHAGKHAECEKRLLDEYERSKKQRSTPAPTAQVASVPASTSLDRKSADITTSSTVAFPPIGGQVKPQRRTPTPPPVTEDKPHSPKPHAGREQNGVRSEHDQEVEEIMEKSVPDTLVSQTSASPPEKDDTTSELEAEVNGCVENESRSPSVSNEDVLENAADSGSHQSISPVESAPEAAQESPRKSAEDDENNVNSPVNAPKSSRCRSPPGFSRRDSPPFTTDISSNTPKLPADIPPPPGLSTPLSGSSILSMLQKQAENTTVSDKPLAKSSNWQDMFGFRTSDHKGDDELGFDPFQESAKALADLVAQESNKERPDHRQKVDEAKLDRHHQRPQRPVAPPPGFSSINDHGNLKWSFGENDPMFSTQQQRQSHQQPQRCFPPNSLLANIFSAQNGNRQARPNVAAHQTVGDRLRQHGQAPFMDESVHNNRYRHHNQIPGYPEDPMSRHHQMMYSEEAMENRRRLQEQHINYSHEDRHRHQNMMNFAAYNQSRGHGVPPPGLDAQRQHMMWHGNQQSSHHIYRDMLGNNEKLPHSEKNETARVDLQAGLRALLPNVNVRFLETSGVYSILSHSVDVFL
ncbi:hypothetical protein QR680_002466 [Steinernema hermaphroditum]|uniref:RING-type domain-containing protein n=1 Tax=Steinernema hermaphroditum TaxID=289476 RepID=A0AA39H2U2_9BILA|nr:hypothetical protein QR680_002466 [Steinernema hermaphroditum]